ncbi:MAG: excalibur calcium-binding domain-containing protein [Microbacteriaceae bacterium]
MAGDALMFEAMLAQLPEDNSPGSHGGYNRDLFNAWIDANGDGCNTRAEVLKSETSSAISAHGTCTIDTGSWYSAYDGIWFTSAKDLDIDHFVPLKEAWVSGAWQWTGATRTAFGNDLGYAASLLAVSSSSNRSKSDNDPARWLPRNSDFYCDYAATWVAVKWRWNLSVDALERDALNRLLGPCSSLSVTVPDRANVSVNPDARNDATSPGGGGSGDGIIDPNFGTCSKAKANGYGPYLRGVDPEYDFYRDADKDGRVCE